MILDLASGSRFSEVVDVGDDLLSWDDILVTLRSEREGEWSVKVGWGDKNKAWIME